jgi:membrane protein YqaA with SNARE-associated domain
VRSLLFAWLPVIGDPLTAMAGALRVNLSLFVLLVGFGKLGRYAVLVARQRPLFFSPTQPE